MNEYKIGMCNVIVSHGACNNYLLVIWDADDVMTRTSIKKKALEDAMKKVKKEMAASVEKARKLQEELGKAEAKIASFRLGVASFVNFDEAFEVSRDKWLLFFSCASGYR